jgi:hypothetical protein
VHQRRTILLTEPRPATYQCDLAISAVPYDVACVAELSAHLELRLRTPIIWLGAVNLENDTPNVGSISPLTGDYSRVAVVLHQRLWGHDAMTRIDETTLRERLERRPESIRVVALDDHPVPEWLSGVARCDLSTDGIAGVSDFLVDAITQHGGFATMAPEAGPATPDEPGWREGPPRFLVQPRALSALRRELDALAEALAPNGQQKKSSGADKTFELQTLPNRIVVRVNDVGVSFSWMAGPLGVVADGRLMVVQWAGATPYTRGVGTLRFATAVRERMYRVDSDGPENWSWRVDSPNGRACSTVNLAAEWLAGAAIVSEA